MWQEADTLLRQVRGKIKLTDVAGGLTATKKSRVHEHKVLAGHVYIIDLESSQFDTFLKAEEADGQLIGQNDDIGVGNTNSRLLMSTRKTGIIRITATSHEEAGIGTYRLTVREIKGPVREQK